MEEAGRGLLQREPGTLPCPPPIHTPEENLSFPPPDSSQTERPRAVHRCPRTASVREGASPARQDWRLGRVTVRTPPYSFLFEGVEESVRKQTTLLRTGVIPGGGGGRRWVLVGSSKEFLPANLGGSPSSHCPACPVTSGRHKQVMGVNTASASVETETHPSPATSASAIRSPGPPLQASVPPSENGISGQDEPRGHRPPEHVDSGWSIQVASPPSLKPGIFKASG